MCGSTYENATPVVAEKYDTIELMKTPLVANRQCISLLCQFFLLQIHLEERFIQKKRTEDADYDIDEMSG